MKLMYELDDIIFRAVQVHRFTAINGALELAPAIACFKSLQVLRIHDCDKLTDACLINGIAKCATLKELEIVKCGSIIEENRNLLGNDFNSIIIWNCNSEDQTSDSDVPSELEDNDWYS